MPLERFCLWTTLGAGLWVTVLTLAGYFLGDATERIWHEHKTVITLGLLVAAGLLGGLFPVWKLVRRRSPRSTDSFGMTVAPPVEGETVPPTKP
jgi:membrane protein DedA with SNARE-associated domain